MYFQPSQQRLLSSLNPFFLLLFIFWVLLLRTTFEPLVPTVFRQWDALLPFVVYFGQRRALAEGLVLTFLGGHLYSLCSSAPIGVFVTYYLALFLIARLISYGIYANTGLSILLLMLSLALLSRIVLLLTAMAYGHGWSFFYQGFALIGGLLLNAILGYVTYMCLLALDKLTFKAPRANIELTETGL